MTRLASIAKAGFYPTPESVTDLIAQCVNTPGIPGGKLLDPCSGEGVAAETLTKAWGLDGYGIELDAQRAQAASKRLTRVLHLDYAAARIALGAFQVLFLNPPYQEGPGEGKRLEYQVLRDATRWLQPAGLLIYLVPQYRVDARMATYLTAAYENLTCWRFPDPEYAIFKQVVIYGIAKLKQTRDDVQAQALIQTCQGMLPLLTDGRRELSRTSGLYALPSPAPIKQFYFRGNQLDPDSALAEAHAVGVGTSAEWRDWLNPPPTHDLTFQPLMPFKKGHLASVIAAGLMQNLRLADANRDLLVKGYTYKVQDTTEEESDDGKTSKTIVRDRFVTEIVTLDLQTGEHKRIVEPSEFAQFVETWRDALTEQVVGAFKPLYQFDLRAEGADVNRVLDGLSKNRHVPGRRETGLFPAQKHASVALWKQLARANYALCVGEPGVGKTTIATTVAQLRRAIDGDTRPTLVLCPPHLTPKWKREIEEIIPGARATIVKRVSDLTAFVAAVETSPATPMFAIMSREMAKLGSGWRPAYVIRKRYTRKDRRHCPEVEEVFACSICGHPVSEVEAGEEVRLVSHPGYFERRKRKCFTCGSPLYQTSTRNGNTPRFPLAEYIARHLKSRFGLFVADEAHQLKGQSTDQGYALGALIRACGKTLALTGTIYGGRSTSLFYLLHRLAAKVRREFAWTDGQRWAERFGVLERVQVEGESDSGHGTYSGKRRRTTFVKELPGVSPELVMQLLDSAVFLGLPDLGFPLPGYVEIAHEIEMTKEMRKAYDAMEDQVRAVAQAARQSKDWSQLAKLTQALLGYPNACFRSESVADLKGEIVAGAPALDPGPLYPKEQWLVDEARAQRDRGRKVIVFCRQTGTRDITARLEQKLIEAGLRVAVLKASVPTDKREAWLAAKAPQIDVCITNPKIVDTGLDLVQFQSAFWYESEYSLFVLMQATKRIYRVGQVNDVEIHFAVYKASLEHRAVALAGQKWSAAQLLYGESVEGALAQCADAPGGFLAELTKSMIANAKVADLGTFFRRAQASSPTVASRRTSRAPTVRPPVIVPIPPVPAPPVRRPVQLPLFALS